MDKDVLCENNVYESGKTYDLYIFNPTADDHPFHIHLVTMQLIGRYALN